MRILIIDDSPLHQQSARQTLADHDLTIVDTYDEAYNLLKEPHASCAAVTAELERRGHTLYPHEMTEEERKARWEEQKRVEAELCPPPSFDLVLSDLLMPASKMTMGDRGMKYVGQEMPVGFALALMASIHGAKYIAVVTDTNHHDHPASAMLDPFASLCESEHYAPGDPPRFVINGAKVGFYHSPMTHVEGTTCWDCDGTGSKEECHCVGRNDGSPRSNCESCKGTGRKCWTCRNSGKLWGKDWGKVVTNLLES